MQLGERVEPGGYLLRDHGPRRACERDAAGAEILERDDALHGFILREGEVAARMVQPVCRGDVGEEQHLCAVHAEIPGELAVVTETALDPHAVRQAVGVTGISQGHKHLRRRTLDHLESVGGGDRHSGIARAQRRGKPRHGDAVCRQWQRAGVRLVCRASHALDTSIKLIIII